MDERHLLHRRFREQVSRTPDAVALVERGQTQTYEELQTRASQVANALRAQDIGAGRYVGLHLERSMTWVAATLGVLETGAAAVPLPPSYPARRLSEMLEFARLDHVIDDLRTPIDETLAEGVSHVEDLRALAGSSIEAIVADPDQPAFVLCSSGSTGQPKMIARSHRSFFPRLEWTWARHPYDVGEVCCQKAHMTTTHAIYELFEPLLRGVPVVIVSDREVRDLDAFWDTVRSRGISRLLLVPSMLRVSLDMPEFSPPPLRVVVLMGEYVDPGLAERAVATFPPDTQLYSIYGSTEASSTLVCDLRASFQPGRELPLGVPISEDVIPLVLKSDLTPVFPDEVGRLYMGGASLFSGYLRSPELTESVFVRTPEVGGRLYDTSDDVRLLSDGTIEYVGRVDHTVKVRGFRVNTQEVEGAILVHPDVATAAVVVRNRGSAHEMLVAFVTPADIDRDDVVRTLRDRLPSYMLPSLIIPLETLPLTVSGKVDRGRLLDMGAAPEDPAGAASRRSTTESRVRAVWKRALGHEQFDDESSYFEVGGTSLRIFDLVARLREEFGLAPAELTVQDVYRFPTVASLAACVDSAEYAEASVEPAPLLVPLKQGADPKAPPFFLIATAGGTLGAYERLAQRLDLPRDVIGVRDPFIWGERDPTKGFRDWIELYLRAIRGRQGAGPYYLGAYSSAGAFGYELARRLREEGEEVALLALIDPLVMDRGSRWRYGYWVLRATYMRSSLREIVRFVGRVRALVHGLTTTLRGATPESDYTPSIELMNHITTSVTRDRGAVMRLAGLMELNTGLPVSLDENDFAGKAPDEYFGVFLSRLAAHLPDVEPESVERIAVQYQLQVNSQHAYQLTPYDGAVLLIEPATGYAGLVATQLRPYLRDLKARILPVGDPSPRVAALARRFGVLDKHYRSMRDDRFVAGVVAELDPLLR